MKRDIQRAKERGGEDLGWLQTRYSFSFAEYYNPKRMHFGALRVLNHDHIQERKGFDLHPHRDMEIITIVLDGVLAHDDRLGNHSTIHPGEVQVMSAGTGILHAEMNPSKSKETELLQIWVTPKRKGVPPRYDQARFDRPRNVIVPVVSGDGDDKTLFIYQDARISLASLDRGYGVRYPLYQRGNGIYVFLIRGSATVEGEELRENDALSLSDVESVDVQPLTDCEVLFIDVPMR